MISHFLMLCKSLVQQKLGWKYKKANTVMLSLRRKTNPNNFWLWAKLLFNLLFQNKTCKYPWNSLKAYLDFLTDYLPLSQR